MARENRSKHFLGGATLVEYVLLVSFIAMAVIITVAAVGEQLEKSYSHFVTCMEKVNQGEPCEGD